MVRLRRLRQRQNRRRICAPHRIHRRVCCIDQRVLRLGTDHLVYAVINVTGETASYDVTIKIKEAPKEVKPSGGSKI
jgi:hypothetical protein